MSLITKIRKRIADGHRVLIHCYGGLGRAVLVAACLVMTIDEDVFTDEVQVILFQNFSFLNPEFTVLGFGTLSFDEFLIQLFFLIMSRVSLENPEGP